MVNGHDVRQYRYLDNYFPYDELDYVNPSFLQWIPHDDLGSKRFNCVDFQLGVLVRRSITESNAYPFVTPLPFDWVKGFDVGFMSSLSDECFRFLVSSSLVAWLRCTIDSFLIISFFELLTSSSYRLCVSFENILHSS